MSGDLDLMLTRGYAVRQEILNKKYETSLEEFRAECFPSFIGIASNRKGRYFNAPIYSEDPGSSGIMGQYTTAGRRLPQTRAYNPAMIFRIRKCFKRLKRTPVLIPFRDQIDKAIAESGVSHGGYSEAGGDEGDFTYCDHQPTAAGNHSGDWILHLRNR